jgi:hypothetical protein
VALAVGAWALPAAAAPEPAVARPEVRALKLEVTGGRWSFVGRGVTLKEAAAEIAAKSPIDIRIQDAALESVKLGMAFNADNAKDAMALVLKDFNFATLDDNKTGRRVYLVTSLAKEAKPVAPPPSNVAAAAPAAQPAGNTRTARARSLEELRPVQPAQVRSREQSQAEIEADYRREREEKLARAIDALKAKDASGAVQQQALAELASSNDPRATAALKDAWTQVQNNPTVNAQVAQSVWRNAAQQQFANNDANALLLSMASSTSPAVQDVARAAKADMERYKAAQNKP